VRDRLDDADQRVAKAAAIVSRADDLGYVS